MRAHLVVVGLVGVVLLGAPSAAAQPTPLAQPAPPAQPSSPQPAPPAQPAIIEPLALTSYQLQTVAPPQVKVSLMAKEGVTDLRAQLVAVTFDDKPRPTTNAAFDVALKNGVLEISVRFDLVRDPGTYGVQVRLTGSTKGADGKATTVQQTIALQLVLSPAKLRTIPTLVVTSYRVAGDKVVTASIKLAELSRVTGLTNLHIEQLDRAIEDNAQIDAELAAEDAPTGLAAGGRIPVTLKGAGFPIGTSTGQLIITADQLAEPVVVAYEIRSKRYTWLILPWFLIFGVTGWLVRHLLKNAEARAELGARLEPLRRQARAQIATHPDPEQILALTNLERNVTDALDGRDQARLEAAAEALRKGLEKALAERAAFVNEKAKQVMALRQGLTPAWKLPDGADLRVALPQLAEAEAALVADRPKDAIEFLEPVHATIDKVGKAVNAWRVRAEQTVKALPEALARTPGSIRQPVTTAAATAQSKLDAVLRYDVAQRPEPIATYLRAVHELHDTLAQLGGLLHVGLTEEVRATVAMAKKVGMEQPAIDEIAEAGALAEPPEDPAEACGKAAKATRAFHDAVEKHIKETEAKKLLAAGRYADAIQKQAELAEGFQKAPPIAHQLQVPEAVRDQAFARTTVPDVPVGFAVVSMHPRAVDPVALARTHLQKIRFLRGFVSATALSLVTWAVYRGSWTGSHGDLVGLAVVAFFTDFTVDALFQAMTALKKTSPA